MTKLSNIAKVIRSKNAGPFTITLDIIFEKQECAIKVFNSLTRDVIGKLFKTDPRSVEIILYKPANAVKINVPRLVPSGHPGDTDVYGAQQHAPLLDLDLEIECG